jgi:hypothetical protein
MRSWVQAGRSVDTLQRPPHPLENRFLFPLLVQKGVQAGRCEDALNMLKGTVPRDIRLQVSTWISFPQTVLNFSKIHRDIPSSKCTTGVATGINNTSEIGGKICRRSSNGKLTFFQDRKLSFCCFCSKKDRIYSFLKQNSGSKQNVFVKY